MTALIEAAIAAVRGQAGMTECNVSRAKMELVSAPHEIATEYDLHNGWTVRMKPRTLSETEGGPNGR